MDTKKGNKEKGTDTNPKTWLCWLATGFYLGKIKKAPGTFGTLGALPLILLFNGFGPLGYMAGAVLFTVLGVFIAQLYETQVGVHDSQEIVIDEMVGFVVSMTWLPLTLSSFFIAFCVFRCLDILKPFPISYLDKKIQGGVGVVADDLLAGIVTNVLLQILYMKTNWLGHQLIL